MDSGRTIRTALLWLGSVLGGTLALNVLAHIAILNLDDLVIRKHWNGFLTEKAPGVGG